MNYILNIVFFLMTLLTATSCANYKIHQTNLTDKQDSLLLDSLGQPTHSIFLIGDVGEKLKNQSHPNLQLLETHLQNASKNSTVLFLGNNAGSKGMPPKGNEKDRKLAENILDRQFDLLKNYEGQPIFIPGNKDWNDYGKNGMERQEKYIESMLNKHIEDEDDWKNYFLPDQGCPGPEVVEINDKLVIIIIDSHWWLMDWDEEPNINNDCDVKNRATFTLALADVIKDHKNKNIVFASHHPFKSSGPHGGKFTLKNHLFPFTNKYKNAYVPLPVVGSTFLFLRQSGILKQDISNSNYRQLVKTALDIAGKNGEYIFAGGHDHSLQYLQDEGQHFIVSGAGSSATATAKNKKSLFSYGHVGFSKINFYKDGTAFVEFWIPDGKSQNGKLVFKQKMKGALPVIKTKIKSINFPEYESGADSILALPTTNKLSKLNKFADYMLGDRRRAVYLEQYNFPTLDLSTFKGGMKIIKKGGGKQTNSLRLATPEGKEYVMRSLTKDLKRGVPYPFNQLPIVNFLFNESYLGSHPFAPLVLPTLADAANVYHTNPGIYYVPKQPSLGDYNEAFGGEVYLVEERPSDGHWKEADCFGRADDFVSTSKLILKKTGNPKHRVDQNWVVRSRLFDMLIGDFDRHGDQWRWTEINTDDGKKIYRPIPRDRDQAFSHFDGQVMKLLSPFHSLVKQLATYNEDVGNPEFNYYNGRHFDHHFMNEMTLEDWRKEAIYIQSHVTDEVIDEAMKFFPTKVNELTGAEINRILKYRRDNIVKIAEDFYGHLAKTSILHGTDKKELFEIVRLNDEETEVKMYDSNKEAEKQELLFHRIYKTSETSELYIYGLEDDDIFNISGEVKKSINLHLIGGSGKDTFIDKSKVAGLGKKDRIYDNKKKNKLELGSEGKNKTSKVYENNSFDYFGNHFDKNSLGPKIILGATSSNGIIVGAGIHYKVFKFNKSPLAQEHILELRNSFATRGLDFQHSSTFYKSINYLDFVVNSRVKGENYTYNFFGIGNETNPEKSGVDFYRVFQNFIHLDLGFQRSIADGLGKFSVRPMVEYSKIKNDTDRFYDSENTSLDAKNFETRWFAGGITTLDFESVKSKLYPLDGFRFRNKFSWQKNISGSAREFSTYNSNFTLYKSLGVKKKVVLASKVGAKAIRGNYDFFYAPTIGEDENVRGFYGQRFRGQSSFYHMSDLRFNLGSVSNSFLPFSMGIVGSYDYGRVFEPEDNSNKWHSSAGGAIWIAPLNLVVLSVSYNKAIREDGARVKVFLGHAF